MSRKIVVLLIVVILVIVVILALVGGFVYYQKQKSREQKQPGQIVEEPTPTPLPPRDETEDLRTYQNKKYGFEVKYNYGWQVTELEPGTADKFIAHIRITDIGGGFTADIQVFKNESLEDSKEQLQNFIKKFYGIATPGWPVELPLVDAQIKDFNVSSKPGIRVDYVMPGESPADNIPASILFTLNKQFIYRMDCVGEKVDCDQIISSFKFIQAGEEKTETGKEGWVLSPDGSFWVYVGDVADKVRTTRYEFSENRFVYCLDIPDKSYGDVDGCEVGEKALFLISVYDQEQLDYEKSLPLFEETDQIFKERNSLYYSFHRPRGVLLDYDHPRSEEFYTQVMESITFVTEE